jgi:ABC-2 type transport system permease protein
MFLLLTRMFRRWKARRAAAAAVNGQGAEAVVNTGASRPASRVGRTIPSAASRGPLALLAHQVRYDLLATARNPRARFFTFLFPVILLVIFVGVFAHKGRTVMYGHNVPLSQFFLGGILAMAIITASYAGLVVTITTARETGVFKRRRATPVPPALMIAGQVVSSLAIAEVMTAILLVVGRIGYGIAMPLGALIATFIAAGVGAIVFACIAYAVAGMIDSVDAAQPVAQLTMMPLYFISGVWIPTASLSHGIRSVASVFPIEHLAAAIHRATVTGSLGSALSATDLLVLAAWGLAAGVFAAMRFSWLPKTAMA